jgi:hypothetical protein
MYGFQYEVKNSCTVFCREAYPELAVYDIAFAYDITKLVCLDEARFCFYNLFSSIFQSLCSGDLYHANDFTNLRRIQINIIVLCYFRASPVN